MLSIQAGSIIFISLNSVKLKFSYNCHGLALFLPRVMVLLAWVVTNTTRGTAAVDSGHSAVSALLL